MGKYVIVPTKNVAAEIDADSAEEAFQAFVKNMSPDMHSYFFAMSEASFASRERLIEEEAEAEDEAEIRNKIKELLHAGRYQGHTKKERAIVDRAYDIYTDDPDITISDAVEMAEEEYSGH